MTEIEKMYENAGIKKREIENCTYKNSTPCGHSCDDGEDCPYLEIKTDYPPFTAEKQIEIIKWLGKLAGKLEISSNYNDTQYLLYFYLNRKTRDEILPNILTGRSENFEESLAGLINSLWQSLTAQEKEEIRRILNE